MAERRAKVRLQTLALCRVARMYDAGRSYDLIGISPAIAVTAFHEFPRSFSQFDLFLRFSVEQSGVEDFYVRLWWISPDRNDRKFVGNLSVKRLQFNQGYSVQDQTIRLANVTFPLRGLYSFAVCRKVRSFHRSKRYLIIGREYLNLGVEQ
jgi:hypothetical protein